MESLPVHLYLDVIEAWLLAQFRKAEQFDEWERAIYEPPAVRLDRVDVWSTCLKAAHATGVHIMQRLGRRIDAVPAGWDDDTLLAESIAAAAGSSFADADAENRPS